MKNTRVLHQYLAVLLPVISLIGCSGNNATVFLHPEYNFQFVERVAVIPFENLSKSQGAGERVTRVFLTELLAERAFDVVEPGEVSRVLEKYATVRTGQLTQEEIVNIGKELKVQSLILGTVAELASVRSGSGEASTATLVVRMVETETGQTVWSATRTAGGKGFWSSLFGTGSKSESGVIRDCVRGILSSLIK